MLRPHIVPDASGQLATDGQPTETGPSLNTGPFLHLWSLRPQAADAGEGPWGPRGGWAQGDSVFNVACKLVLVVGVGPTLCRF